MNGRRRGNKEEKRTQEQSKSGSQDLPLSAVQDSVVGIALSVRRHR
jgi:hypothetical protein